MQGYLGRNLRFTWYPENQRFGAVAPIRHAGGGEPDRQDFSLVQAD